LSQVVAAALESVEAVELVGIFSKVMSLWLLTQDTQPQGVVAEPADQGPGEEKPRVEIQFLVVLQYH
jgi:hypothetical protein